MSRQTRPCRNRRQKMSGVASKIKKKRTRKSIKKGNPPWMAFSGTIPVLSTKYLATNIPPWKDPTWSGRIKTKIKCNNNKNKKRRLTWSPCTQSGWLRECSAPRWLYLRKEKTFYKEKFNTFFSVMKTKWNVGSDSMAGPSITNHGPCSSRTVGSPFVLGNR